MVLYFFLIAFLDVKFNLNHLPLFFGIIFFIKNFIFIWFFLVIFQTHFFVAHFLLQIFLSVVFSTIPSFKIKFDDI